jgi:hypothetical protein
MNKYYTGIGSRDTPQDVLELMRKIARKMAFRGFILRSGGAIGADSAFADGWDDANWSEDNNEPSKYEIERYIPWEGFNDLYSSTTGVYLMSNLPINTTAQDIAKEIHPNWHRLSKGAKALHTRNVYQVLGKNLNTPSTGLICWAPIVGGNPSNVMGGTRTAVEIALQHNVPVFNLNYIEHFNKFKEWVECDLTSISIKLMV